MNTNILRKNVAFLLNTAAMISMLQFVFQNFRIKEADIAPVHKKKAKVFRENHRPISILPNIAKI